MQAHEQANQSYIEEGIQLLELGDKAYDLYTAQPPEEQRRLLNCVVSHATWGNGFLSLVYRPPFDLIAHSNREYACNHKGSDDFEAQKENWLPGADNCRNFFERFTFCPESLKRRAKPGAAKECREPYRHPLTLAYEFQQLLEAGVVNNRAEIARRYGLSRARVTQVMSLLHLPDEIQGYIMALPPREQRRYSGRRLREIIGLASGRAQVDAFEELQNEMG